MASSSSGRDCELDPCPICLNPLVQEAYLDRCFHVFCYPCIVYWTRLVTEKQSLSSIKCPLCKTENLSIIHGYTGDSFQQNYVNKDGKKSSLSDSYEFRLKFYGASSRMRNGPFDVQRYWKSHRYLLKNTWLKTWLRREIQALSQVEDVDIVMHHIHGVVDSFIKSKEKEGRKCTPEQNRNAFRHLLLDAGRPFLHGRIDQFVNELEQFLASGLNIQAYDKVCLQHFTMSSSSETHDKEVCNHLSLDPQRQLIFEDSDDAE
ncbi:Zinc finger RING/FYVE/PHD-type protein [Dioscorea alata]|uniref:Zinc finger RING/FYVE/PHD-type protein n=1 Tax=Dioscorea alata TaxID=55571 RepID=A0ACB7VY99_DIOAL|nr:Zinc finger RING/FYVE/PHD-type protein [Dioscorea alata]